MEQQLILENVSSGFHINLIKEHKRPDGEEYDIEKCRIATANQ
jgi:hypothetical protein